MNKLDAAVNAYRSFNEKTVITGRQVRGRLSEENYSKCKSQLEDCQLLISSWDDKRELEFTLPSEKDALFAVDMDDLLRAPSRLLTPPERFYLADIDYVFFEGVEYQPDIVKGYLNVSLFASTLNDISDHSLPLVPKSIFLQGEKLELSLSYSSGDLKILEGLEEFIDNFVKADIHKDKIATIIKGALIEMLKSSEIDQLTVSCLIKRFTEFIDRVNANYQLYVSEFSFDKIKERVETEKFEFTLKLNKVFSEIQNQLLAVPLALVLVSSQMKVENGLSFLNMSIWCGVLIFGFFMSLLIKNQRSTLNAIKLEIDSQWNSIEAKHQFVAARLGCHYRYLRKRQKDQSLTLFLVDTIVSIAIAGSTILLLYNSKGLYLYKDVLYFGFFGGVVYFFSAVFFEKIGRGK